MNTSSNDTKSKFEFLKATFQKYQEVPLAIIIAIGLVANSMVIINGIRRRKAIKHYSIYFVLSMAFADLCIVVFTIPMIYVEYLLGLEWMNGFTCSYVIQIRETFQGVVIFSISCLAILRLRQVLRNPLGQVTKRTCRLLVAAIWVTSFLLCTVPFFDIYKLTNTTCDPDWPSNARERIHMTVIIFILLSPMLVATFAYGIVLFKVTHTLSSDVESENLRNRNRSMQVLILMLISSCWITYTPLSIFLVLDVYEESNATVMLWQVVAILYLGGSALNPVLVLLSMPKDYRFNALHCQCKRQRRVGAEQRTVQQKVVLQSTFALQHQFRNGVN